MLSHTTYIHNTPRHATAPPAVDRMYPAIKVSFCRVQAGFSPAVVGWIGDKLDVPRNLCFMACPDAQFRHRIAHFGGMRVITH